MYKLASTLFTLFSLVLPIVAIPGPASKVDGLEKRTTGIVRGICSHPVRDADPFGLKGTYFIPGLGACGQTNSASELVVAISSAIYEGGADCFHVR